MTLKLILTLFSGGSFIIYGISSFFSKKMKLEYERWEYGEQRILIGVLQFLGGLGLFFGLYFEPLIPLSSASLLLLMLAAMGVRIKIKDKPLKILPAFFYAAINFLILINSAFNVSSLELSFLRISLNFWFYISENCQTKHQNIWNKVPYAGICHRRRC